MNITEFLKTWGPLVGPTIIIVGAVLAFNSRLSKLEERIKNNKEFGEKRYDDLSKINETRYNELSKKFDKLQEISGKIEFLIYDFEKSQSVSKKKKTKITLKSVKKEIDGI